jgi:hypothetical protein
MQRSVHAWHTSLHNMLAHSPLTGCLPGSRQMGHHPCPPAAPPPIDDSRTLQSCAAARLPGQAAARMACTRPRPHRPHPCHAALSWKDAAGLQHAAAAARALVPCTCGAAPAAAAQPFAAWRERPADSKAGLCSHGRSSWVAAAVQLPPLSPTQSSQNQHMHRPPPRMNSHSCCARTAPAGGQATRPRPLPLPRPRLGAGGARAPPSH